MIKEPTEEQAKILSHRVALSLTLQSANID